MPRHRIERRLALHEDRAHADLVQTGFAQRFIRALPPLLEGALACLLLRRAIPASINEEPDEIIILNSNFDNKIDQLLIYFRAILSSDTSFIPHDGEEFRAP